jgi:signal transduction histidine kinase/CheY-like chemotaxis protein
MRLNQTRGIKLNIMSIAFMGSIVFAFYLVINFLVASANEQRIEELQKSKFIVLESLVALTNDVDQIREALTNAIILENSFLIEEAMELAPAFEKRLADIEQHIPEEKAAINSIRLFFYNYLSSAKILASKLVDSPNNLNAYEESASNTHIAFRNLNHAISNLLADRQEDYSHQLDQITQSLKTTNIVAALIGIAFVCGLIIMTWLTTRRVVKAVTRADRLKESFLTTISHELRTPMNGIVGALSLLKESKLDESQAELLDIATDSSENMTKTVDDILTLTDLMSGKPQIVKLAFNEKEWVGDMLTVARNCCQYKGLNFKYYSDLQDVTLFNDRQKLTIVCRQLLENAIKYTIKGQVFFKISHELNSDVSLKSSDHTLNGRAVSSGTLTVVISDNGPGLSSEMMQDIYTPFVQEDGGFKRAHQGIGIGLAMSKMLVRSLGGTLSLTNKQGEQGVVAKFTIPCEFDDQSALEVNSNALTIDTSLHTEPLSASNVINFSQSKEKIRQPETVTSKTIKPKSAENTLSRVSASLEIEDYGSTETDDQQEPLQQSSVLIVEDNRVNQQILSKIMRKMNFQVIIAANGQEALQQLQSHDIDLILMDCQMPVMDGFEATEKIRQLGDYKAAIPIIAVTANARDIDKQRCFDAGMNGFLGKPVNFSTVKKSIESYVRTSA